MKIQQDKLNELIDICSNFYNSELKRHNDASHPINVLLFLVDNNYEDNPKLKELNQQLMAHEFNVIMNIPESYNGSGQSTSTWIICDLPLSVYISILLNNKRIDNIHEEYIEKIVNMMECNGWRCTNKGNLGKFRGPGKKEDECPLATLNVLKMLTLTNDNEYLEAKEKAIKTLLSLWNERKQRKAYLFGIGTDFKKLKYPLIWYDILNEVNVLSHYQSAINTNEFKEMYSTIKSKEVNGNFIPESVYQFWKGYDFGQKKMQSEYLKETISDIDKRIRLTNAST